MHLWYRIQDGYSTREGDNLNANTGVTGNTGHLREGEVIPNHHDHHDHHNAGGVGNTNIGATGGGITGNQGVSGAGSLNVQR